MVPVEGPRPRVALTCAVGGADPHRRDAGVGRGERAEQPPVGRPKLGGLLRSGQQRADHRTGQPGPVDVDVGEHPAHRLGERRRVARRERHAQTQLGQPGHHGTALAGHDGQPGTDHGRQGGRQREVVVLGLGQRQHGQARGGHLGGPLLGRFDHLEPVGDPVLAGPLEQAREVGRALVEQGQPGLGEQRERIDQRVEPGRPASDRADQQRAGRSGRHPGRCRDRRRGGQGDVHVVLAP